eukprot:356543-Chlamydomonas_euryale.AAC.16
MWTHGRVAGRKLLAPCCAAAALAPCTTRRCMPSPMLVTALPCQGLLLRMRRSASLVAWSRP